MPPMIATPLAIPTDTKQEEDMEFELDIRISTSKTLQPTLNVTNYGTGCCTDSCNSCNSCNVTCGNTCGTCDTCSCYTPASGYCCY